MNLDAFPNRKFPLDILDDATIAALELSRPRTRFRDQYYVTSVG
jgi:hypothetical protein